MSCTEGMPQWHTGSRQVHGLRCFPCPGRRRVRGLARGPVLFSRRNQPNTNGFWSGAAFARIQRRSEVEARTKYHVVRKWVSQSHVGTGSWSSSWCGVVFVFLSGNDGNWFRWTDVTDKRHHSWVETRFQKGWKFNNKGVSDSEDSVPKTSQRFERQRLKPSRAVGRVKDSGSPAKSWPVITQRQQDSERCW